MSFSVEMRMLRNFYFMLLAIGAIQLATVTAQDDQSGFISIDCGIPQGTNYTDKKTGLIYVSDTGFIDSGVRKMILPAYNYPTLDIQLITLTSFPHSTRNCYTLRPKQGKGNRYLIRARFHYGNYDFKGQRPQFDLYLGSDHWYTVNFSASLATDYEIIHLTSSDYIYVCLVNIGLGTPFISALELRLLDSSMYASQLQSLILFARTNFGASETVRYGDDKYDRIWYTTTSTSNRLIDVHTSGTASNLGSSTANEVPSKVMSTALTNPNITGDIYYPWMATDATQEFFIYLYIAEIETLKSNQKREFYISLNGVYQGEPVSPLYNTTTAYLISSSNSSVNNITLHQTESSTLPPIFNAIELYNPIQLLQQHTEDQDVEAIWSIKSTYGITRNWQGDPCVRQASVWDGINCSYNDTENPRIISLNLSSSGLSGEIADALANLTMIRSLDLSYNNLTGNVPKFLASLSFLQMINLTGNNFARPLPSELLEKSKKGSLFLSIEVIDDQHKGYCLNGSCKSKKHTMVVILVHIVALLVFIGLLVTCFIVWRYKWRETTGSTIRDATFQPRNKQYTYSEVQSITDNFTTVIGRGGFGTVFLGSIGGNKLVAVKMLSESSSQGYKEFQAEIKLLMDVRHKNITPLVGYCNDSNHKAIIYEYMANGNLRQHLFDQKSNVLSWERRLQIGCDAAEGLVYMHDGCRPPIVHRDVKPTNILLNEGFQAKLADFGMSRAFTTEDATDESTRIMGTLGYLDPEYHLSNRLTMKSDVYSFGIVLLELITSRRALSGNIDIINWVKSTIAEGHVEHIIDPKLEGNFNRDTAWKVVELAIACVSYSSIKRPTMNDVVMELKYCLQAEQIHCSTPDNESLSLNLETMRDPVPR